MNDAMDDESGMWRTFGERSVYESPSVRLGQIDVELRGGERVWHDVVRLHRVAMMVLLDDQGRVLLLWRHRVVQDRWGWELPGGLVDVDEEPAAAAARELEEQAGYLAAQVEPVMTFEPFAGTVDAEHFVYVGRNPEQIGEPTDSTGEVARIEWTPLAAVPGLIAAGGVWNAGSLVALLRLLMKDA